MRVLIALLIFILTRRMAYGTPTDPVTLTIITVAYAVANLLNPIRWLRAMTGGADPPGTGYMVTSDSTTTTSWKNGTAAILAVLGYTPVSKLGDTMTGDLTWSDNGEGTVFSSGSKVRDSSGFPGFVVTCDSGSFFVYDEAQATQLLRVISAETGPFFKTQEIWHDGNTALRVTNAKMAAGAAVANIGYTPPKFASSTYNGNNGASRQITTGFICKYVRLTAVNGAASIVVDIVSATAANNIKITGSGAATISQLGVTTLHASDGFVVDGSTDATNNTGVTYTYEAFG